MELEKLRESCIKHIKMMDHDHLTGIYQIYARENLFTSDKEAEEYAYKMVNTKKAYTSFDHKYRTPYANLKFYYWYDKHYITHLFPNAFESWEESYFKVVDFILHAGIIKPDGLAKNIYQKAGKDGLFRLAKEWTGQFEKRLSVSLSGRQECYDSVEEFCVNKNNERSLYTTVLDYLCNNHDNVFRLGRDGEYPVKGTEVAEAIQNNDLAICFFHPLLSVYNGTHKSERINHNRSIDEFLSRYGRSPFVKQITRGKGYRVVAISVLCTDPNIISYLFLLDMNGSL